MTLMYKQQTLIVSLNFTQIIHFVKSGSAAVHGSLVCGPCFALERGVRIAVFQHSCLEFQFRVGVWTLALHVLSRVVMSLLGRALVRPRVFCVVARSSYFYRLRAFMLCIELCGTHLVFFSSLAHTHANVPTHKPTTVDISSQVHHCPFIQ